MTGGWEELELSGVGNGTSIALENNICAMLKESVQHGICVSNLAYRISRELGMEESVCYELSVAGVLHDIGKLKLNSYLYGDEEDTMTVERLRYIRQHPKLGYDILKNGDYSDFILESVLFHHENYDGSGYPENLSGENIPVGARILRVCDVFAALISDRSYRKAFDMETAVELMIDEVKNFDMKIFLVFMKIIHSEDINVITGKEEKR